MWFKDTFFDRLHDTSQLFEHLGGSLRALSHKIAFLLYMQVDAFAGLPLLAQPKGYAVRLQLWQQIFFTAFQPFRLTLFIGCGIGFLAIFPFLVLEIAQIELLALTYQLMIYNTMIPLMCLLIVIGRSGMAITTEVANYRIEHTLECLLSMGIEPNQFLVLPRILGIAIALSLMGFWMTFAALFSSSILYQWTFSVAFSAVFESCMSTLSFQSLLIHHLQMFGIAVLLVSIHCYYGFISLTTTDLARNVPRAFVRSLISCLILIITIMELSNG